MTPEEMREHASDLFEGTETPTVEQDIAMADISERWLMTAERCEGVDRLTDAVYRLAAAVYKASEAVTAAAAPPEEALPSITFAGAPASSIFGPEEKS